MVDGAINPLDVVDVRGSVTLHRKLARSGKPRSERVGILRLIVRRRFYEKLGCEAIGGAVSEIWPRTTIDEAGRLPPVG